MLRLKLDGTFSGLNPNYPSYYASFSVGSN